MVNILPPLESDFSKSDIDIIEEEKKEETHPPPQIAITHVQDEDGN